ncbi:putative MYND domain protein [Aspergillus homomorphus CBS 101889]|uniref:MYND domain protein n=1 Tax=Aspergillus homomorphus (strain CBS 101889) TaxID=1450537 RepID=A0A395HWF0_ASPHC|nr:MYND domain protein [Aspergillus homomorphus CBS 101889]RAL12127.1 MYND domain protein [Aspergillus homomorphus CBS 101889]
MQALQERADLTARLYEDPHNPHLYYERGLIHEKLGFPDLASADAYRALSLLDSVVDPDGCEFHARRRIQDPSDTSKPDAESSDEDDDGDDDDQFTALTQSEYDALIHPVYALLVRTLVSCGCFRDAYEFCAQGLSSSSSSPAHSPIDRAAHATLTAQLAILQREYARRRNDPVRTSSSSTDNDDNEQQEQQQEQQLTEPIVIDDPSVLPAQGFARRVLYPWNEHEPDRKAPATLALLNEKLRTVAPKCEVRAVALPALHSTTTNTTTPTDPTNPAKKEEEKEEEEEVSVQLGLFAKEAIAPGETLLHETSLLTATNRLHDDLCDACNGPLPDLSAAEPPVPCANGCADTIFCSQTCHDDAQRVYHGAVCGLMENLESIGKDIPDPKDKADYLYLLLLGRALAMAATQAVHPLELDEVKFIWGDFVDYQRAPDAEVEKGDEERGGGDGTLPFSFQLNILQPMRLLEEMEIDPYVHLRAYDTWVLNTLYAKFRGTASGRLSTWDGGPELCAVHPLWCLANHSCDPNVRWEWGGEITFVARAEGERAVWHSAPDGASVPSGYRREGAGIRKDEEILNHYCDIGLGVRDRREWARGALGGFCLCERCRFEAGEL